MPKVSCYLHFPTNKPDGSGCVFTPEAVKDICSQIKNKPIKIVKQGHSFLIGHIEEGTLAGDVVKCQGELYCEPTFIERNGRLEIISIDLVSKPMNISTRFKMISNAPQYKVGEHVYILRRVNDSRVISSEKIRQVHAGKHSISYTLYGETIRRKQADIFKTYEDAERELKRGTTL